MRVRAAIAAEADEIATLTDPYQVAARTGVLGGAIGDAARALISRGAACGIVVIG